MNPELSATQGRDLEQPAAWGAVYALALGAFVLVASEFMPVSLLTPIAGTLRVSEGQAGQAIAISGAFALLTSLCIARFAARLDRRTLLLALGGMAMVSGAVAAFAPNYPVFMLGRAMVGIAIGGFWSMSAATAMRLVPRDEVPRALAIVNGGNALATVVAAPLGAWLGAVIGWRGAFFCVVPVAAIAFAWKFASLPAMPTGRAGAAPGLLRLLRRPVVVRGMAAVSLFFMGQFALFTYLRPFLETVTGVRAPALSLMLLAVGAAGMLGTILIGAVLRGRLYRALVVMPLLLAVLALGLVAFGSSVAATALLLTAWGLVATAAPVGWWTWLAQTLPQDAEAGGGLMVAVVQLAIMLGALVGGLLFDAGGHRATFLFAALLLVAASALALLAGRTDHCADTLAAEASP